MSWYRITFTRDDIVAGKERGLLDELRLVMTRRGAELPDDFGVLSTPFVDEPGTWVEVYFPPDAAQVFDETMARYGAVECEKPLQPPATLLVARGHPRRKYWPAEKRV